MPPVLMLGDGGINAVLTPALCRIAANSIVDPLGRFELLSSSSLDRASTTHRTPAREISSGLTQPSSTPTSVSLNG